MRQLLTEFYPVSYDQKLIIESVGKNGTITIKAIVQRANARNQNGRVYPRQILEREVERYSQFIKERRALGSLDHPNTETVELQTACLNVTELFWKGDDLLASLEILSTPCGNIVKELMRNNITLGVSSRGVGGVNQTMMDGVKTDEVDEDYHLICFDIVSNPSTQGAFLIEGVTGALNKAHDDRINDLIISFFNETSK